MGDRYYITYEALGKPQAPRDVFVPGLGTVYLDDADIYYAKRTAGAAFYIRLARPSTFERARPSVTTTSSP